MSAWVQILQCQWWVLGLIKHWILFIFQAPWSLQLVPEKRAKELIGDPWLADVQLWTSLVYSHSWFGWCKRLLTGLSYLAKVIQLNGVQPWWATQSCWVVQLLFDICAHPLVLGVTNVNLCKFEWWIHLDPPYTSSLQTSVKQRRWPDWGLNPGPSRHIPDALTTELSGLYQQIN